MRISEEEKALWVRIAKSQFIGFRFGDAGDAPVGLVFEVDGNRLIVRADGDKLMVEDYW